MSGVVDFDDGQGCGVGHVAFGAHQQALVRHPEFAQLDGRIEPTSIAYQLAVLDDCKVAFGCQLLLDDAQ